jgi:hypothetical protein
MKALLGIVGGFVLTLAVFCSGLVFAAWILAAKPVRQATPSISVVDLWTRDARPVNRASQSFQRIPAEQTQVPDGSALAKGAAPDSTATSAVQPSTGDENSPAELPPAHVEWCASHYRSYKPEDNSYRAYTGRQRQCISPYLDVASEQTPNAGFDEASFTSNGDESTEVHPQLSAEQIDSCFSRYRSYRPEDNSYQPYSGGPRRQCQ